MKKKLRSPGWRFFSSPAFTETRGGFFWTNFVKRCWYRFRSASFCLYLSLFFSLCNACSKYSLLFSWIFHIGAIWLQLNNIKLIFQEKIKSDCQKIKIFLSLIFNFSTRKVRSTKKMTRIALNSNLKVKKVKKIQKNLLRILNK